jgi:outer membrane receptor protein involved in Fe transport
VGTPFDTRQYHSFYVCTNCGPGVTAANRIYELVPRGSVTRTPWTFDLGASIAYNREVWGGDLNVKFAVYNLLNRQQATQLNENRDLNGPIFNPTFLQENGFQAPRYGQLTVSLDF